jgi:hypothetical protein
MSTKSSKSFKTAASKKKGGEENVVALDLSGEPAEIERRGIGCLLLQKAGRRICHLCFHSSTHFNSEKVCCCC